MRKLIKERKKKFLFKTLRNVFNREISQCVLFCVWLGFGYFPCFHFKCYAHIQNYNESFIYFCLLRLYFLNIKN